MQDIISALYDYICEQTPSVRNDPEYLHAVKEYLDAEEEIKEKIGGDLLSKYQRAEDAYSRPWELAIFRQTLRFCHGFMLEILR